MAAVIEIAGLRATLEDGTWSSDNDWLAGILNEYLPAIEVSGADPNPENTIAEASLELLGGGEVISVDQPPFDPDVEY